MSQPLKIDGVEVRPDDTVLLIEQRLTRWQRLVRLVLRRPAKSDPNGPWTVSSGDWSRPNDNEEHR